ncbi:MAG: 4-(cytidine 5'-diphospho)-2-C-methyl-D-erythritol kinase [Gemmataceae bacterium]|nr:4-(cytidine 5'-diphospho)-2-C-methyl-D-erythritol kinase [Gemmataceae bacterium]MDW8266807.1 4-(cytidine 5'-diphospho)-2-C-methyl-D-erythritol kinase [Gemmataceae bacterium]
MVSEQQADAVVVWAPAKVNLFLEVLAKRDDGYHEIATLMLAVSWYDTLEFKPGEPGVVRLRCDHPTLSAGPDNLVLRAADRLRQRIGHPGGADIRLTKRIPLAAGLGGGSSDAAATLLGLNRLWGLGLSAHELADLGAELGSDVAFFFSTPAAWCTGRGERVTPHPVGCPLHFVLVCPPVGLSTAEVYRQVEVPREPRSGEEIGQAVADGDIAAVGQLLHNRLQPAAERLCPLVADWHARLARLQPAGVLLSGSGSSLFALCRGRREALGLARTVATMLNEDVQPRIGVVRSCW